MATVSASGLVETELLVSLDQDKIGDLNEKIIENMNKTFDMTRSRLTEALVELDSAIKALDEETQNKKEQLVEACIGLNGTTANLQALLAEETILNARKAAFEQEREGLLQLEGLKPVFTILFPNGVKSLSPEKYQMIIEQASPSLPQQLAGLSQEEMADVEETITNAPARLAAIESELQNISCRLSVFNAMKPQLEKGLKKL